MGIDKVCFHKYLLYLYSIRRMCVIDNTLTPHISSNSVI